MLEVIKQERINYFANIINSAGNKNKTMFVFTKDDSNHIISESVKVADAFGVFISRAVRYTRTHYFGAPAFSCTLPARHDKSTPFHAVTTDEVIDTVRKLLNKTSAGFDDVPTSVIKVSVDVVYFALAEIMSACVAVVPR